MGPFRAGKLGPGGSAFNFAAAFDRPVRIINDAAMQALGSYEGGRCSSRPGMVWLALIELPVPASPRR